ncbi:MAG: choice-of-anchor D domain-containing protein [Kofleriaceae bacterium]
MRSFWITVGLLGWAGTRAEAANASLDFGPVDIGTSSVRYLNVSSLNVDAPQITSADLDDPAGWFTFAGSCTGTSCAFVPAIDLGGPAQVIPVRCTPPTTAVGTHVAQIHLHNSGAGGDPSQLPTLICTASSGLFELTPANGILDFGGIDLGPVMHTATAVVKLKNVGTATVTPPAAQLTGTDAGRFTFTPFGGAPLAPGQTIQSTITYTPNAERSLVNPDRAQLTLQIVGPSTGNVTIELTGHGIDRHASLVGVAPVPDAFINPGGAGPQIAITIANTGEAVLGLSNPMVTGAPVWTVANPEPVDMPGGTTFAYKVRFAPDAIGAAAPATFTVHTSDPANPTITATLAGSGKARDVTMGPAMIDLQYAGVGSTVKASDGTRGAMLQIVNHDPDNDFEIHSFVLLDPDDAFDIPVDAHTTLPAGGTLTFDVAFTPPRPGMFDATAVLRLDQDDEPAATVSLHGEGVFVDAIGGGGCSTGGGVGGAMVIVIGMLVLRRRRLAIAVVLASASAHAEPRDLDLAIFDPTPATSASWFQLQSAQVGREGDWAASALVSYASDPLVLRTSPNDNVTIADRMMLELGGAYAFGDHFEIGLRCPLYLQSGENLTSPTTFGEPAAAGTAIGDLFVHAKAMILRSHRPDADFAVGTSVALGLPTATDDEFAGSSKPQLDALALVSFAPPGFEKNLAFSLEAGVVLRSTTIYHDIDQGNGMLWGVGASYRVRPDLALTAEVFGELVPNGLRDAPTGSDAMGPPRLYDAIEGLIGAHYQMERRVNLGFALGRGLTSAPGTPAVRGVLTVTFAPSAEKPIAAKPKAGDADHDGIPNDLDRCPDEPEDKDGFQDDDGCPDLDNDSDGIADAKDKCPDEAEDKDGFEDDDGCPDLDNDKDGIPDRTDRCPSQPETINGVDDEDGCPDAGAGLVTLDKDRVKLEEGLKFATGKIAPESFNVMGQLGATLRAHTELSKLRITGHTKGRAQIVLDWLVQYGIAAERLEAKTGTGGGDGVDIEIVDRTGG